MKILSSLLGRRNKSGFAGVVPSVLLKVYCPKFFIGYYSLGQLG